ncbi:hypothetical protein BN14_03938 [Rhizoctonia solani AG-1 IB]|uniref:Cation-transporting P-type ATPase N-terminal domain-containing protein n=1 Tax=Thanatephorus cucumeris (strain AG1-IB / isolate 7/3/14) TaxID=1108050 RepID=M5BRR8_THACB|nr:hypothetical protein BN14_03938 [Rhizoctonia solani AG-1 IB]
MNKPTSNGTPSSTGPGSSRTLTHSVLPATGDVDEPPIPRPAPSLGLSGLGADHDTSKRPGALSTLDTCTTLTIDNTDADPVWHVLTPAAVARHLSTDTELGLTGQVVAERIAQYGKNQLKEPEGVSVLKVLLAQPMH